MFNASNSIAVHVLQIPNKFKGGGDKSASRNQLSLIRNKAQEQGKNPEELAASRFGKHLQDLKGCEADSLIKELLTRTR